MLLTIALTLYLVIVGFALNEVYSSYNDSTKVNQNTYTIGSQSVDLMLNPKLSLFSFSIINTLLFYIPVILDLVLIATLFFPTGNAGA